MLFFLFFFCFVFFLFFFLFFFFCFSFPHFSLHECFILVAISNSVLQKDLVVCDIIGVLTVWLSLFSFYLGFVLGLRVPPRAWCAVGDLGLLNFVLPFVFRPFFSLGRGV